MRVQKIINFSLCLCVSTILHLVVLPYSTAECERGFSTMNDIKTDTRNRLGDILLDLMPIAMYGDEHEFDYETLGGYVAKEIWHYKKP